MVAKVSPVRNGHTPFERILSSVLLLVLLAFGAFLGYKNMVISKKRTELMRTAAALEAQIEELRGRQSALEALEGERETDFAKEKILRERGKYKKEGEEVVTILSNTERKKTEEAPERAWLAPLEFFKRVFSR